MRYVAFLDILGFADLVKAADLNDLISRLNHAVGSARHAQALGEWPKDGRPSVQQLDSFSFSDTFVLSSKDDSIRSFEKLVTGTSILARHLFAQAFPVRGAITCGEAEALPGTHHFVGRAIIRAAELEKAQDWFGVLIDPAVVSEPLLNALGTEPLRFLATEYETPFKTGWPGPRRSYVLNWRLNLEIKAGIKSLFTPAPDEAARAKQENTFAFCRHLRRHKLARVFARDSNGQRISIPCINRIFAGDTRPVDGVPYALDDGL